MLFVKSFMEYQCKYVFSFVTGHLKKIKSLGLTNTYLESLDICIAFKNLCSLAFLPHKELVARFEELENALENIDSDISDVYAYFKDTY